MASVLKEALSPLGRGSWLWAYFRRHKKLVLLVVFLGFAAYFSAAALMFTSGYLISKAATQPYNILLIYTPIVLVRAFGIARPSFRYAERLAGHHFVLRLTSDLRLRLYQALEPYALNLRNKYKTGDMLGVLADDIEHIQNLLLRTILPAVLALLLYGTVVLFLGFFSIPFALLMLLWLGGMIVIFPLASVLVNGARTYRQKALRAAQYQSLTDGVLGVADWLFSGRSQDFVRAWEEKESELANLRRENNRFSRRRNFLWQVMAGLLIIALLLWSGHLAGQGNLNANWIAAFVLAAFPLLEALAPLPENLSTLPVYGDSLRRMDMQKPEKQGLPGDPDSLPNAPLTLSLENLSFQYDEGRPVLQDINLRLLPGQKIALLGPSGAGKSTLLSLIRGDLVPTEGTVCLNGVSANLLGEYAPSFVGVLNQRPYLFDTTIGNNVGLGNLQATEPEIREALIKAGLRVLLDQLPLGLDTPVEEAGARFSGGERQRIALARILLRKPPLVLLDEPTTGLDPQLAKSLLETVFEHCENESLIWVTHQLTGAGNMDKIIFLDKGRIVMEGTHDELWKSSKRYRILYNMDSL